MTTVRFLYFCLPLVAIGLLETASAEFRVGFLISAIATLVGAILFACRHTLLVAGNAVMETLARCIHGERQSHGRRRRPSNAAKYESLAAYLNGNGAGRRTRRRRSRPRRLDGWTEWSAAATNGAYARDVILSDAVFTNGPFGEPIRQLIPQTS